jgi:predicted esterase
VPYRGGNGPSMSPQSQNDPHADQPIVRTGTEIVQADAVAIFLHGRGSSAQEILSLYEELGLEGVSAIAPQAAGHTWYPQSFLAALAANQPYLDSAIASVDFVVQSVLSEGIPANRIALVGFSQGACLASEYLARNPRRYGGAIILTGGLVGPPGTPRDYPGSLEGTPIFLGTSDPDPHVPVERVLETKTVFERMGAHIELRRYPGMPHTINSEELAAARSFIQAITLSDRTPTA